MSCHSGPAPELTVAQVLKVFLPEYLDRQALPVHHLKVLRRLAQCRSGQLGWTVWQCQQCHRTHWRPHGCGDRHCPSCQHQRSRQWLQEQRRALLPVRYFHWVFTLPAPLRPLILQNPAPLYRLLFESASATLLQFGQQRFQAELGLTAILHTWGQNLMNRPHLHCLVTGGGLTAQDTWAGPKQTRWLFPVTRWATCSGPSSAPGCSNSTPPANSSSMDSASPSKTPAPSRPGCARCALAAGSSSPRAPSSDPTPSWTTWAATPTAWPSPTAACAPSTPAPAPSPSLTRITPMPAASRP